MASSWARRTGRGMLWSGAGFVVSRLVTFVSILVLARLLTPSQFGVVAAITVFLTLIELVSDLGMKAVVVYEQEDGITARVRTAFTMNLGFAVVLTAIGLLTAPLVAGFFRIEEHVDLFRLAALNLLIAALGNVHDSTLVRSLDFRRRIRPEVARGVTRAAVGIALAITGAGAASLVWGLLAGTVVWVGVLWAMVPLRPALHLDRAIARSMIVYGGAAAAHQLLSEIGRFADATAIGRVLGERSLGLYSVAIRVPELLVRSVGWNVSTVLFPALSRRRADGDQPVGATTLGLVRLQALYVVPMTAGLAALGTALIVVLFSDTWREAGAVLAPLSILAALDVLLSPLGDGMKAVGRQRVLVAINLVAVPVVVAAVIVAAPAGIVAVAWTLVAVAAGFALALGYAATRTLGIGVGDIARSLGPGLAAGAGTAAGVAAVRLALPQGELVPVALASAAGFLGAVAALRVLAAGTFFELTGVARSFVPTRAASS